jgi:hypothetical protein
MTLERFVVCVLCALGCLVAAPVHAQDLSVQVQPTAVDKRLDPGTSFDGALTVTNRSGTTQEFSLSVRSVASVDDSGRPQFADDTDDIPAADDITAWVTLSQGKVTIAPSESAVIGYRITVPKDASPGGHFGSIFVDREADRNQSTGASVGFKVGSLLSIHVNGDVRESLSFVEFATKKLVHLAPSVAFLLKVENTGTVLERPRGVIEIQDMLGAPVANISVNDGGGAALPNSERLFEVVWNDDGFRIGRYTAIATLSYGIDSKTSITRSNSFWIIPIKPLSIVFGILLVAFLILWIVLRLSVKRALAKAGMAQGAGKRTAVATTIQPSFGARLAKVMVLVLTVLLLCLMILFILMA